MIVEDWEEFMQLELGNSNIIELSRASWVETRTNDGGRTVTLRR